MIRFALPVFRSLPRLAPYFSFCSSLKDDPEHSKMAYEAVLSKKILETVANAPTPDDASSL